MKGFRWLHLSDLHLRSSQKYDAVLVLDGLLKLLQKDTNIEEFRPIDAVFFTGDIAFSGKTEEYAQAMSFLERLAQTAKIPRECMFIVPGNHDLDRSLILPGLRPSIDSHERSDEAFESDGTIALLSEKFGAYKKLAKEFPGAALHGERLFLSRIAEINGHRVGVVGLNTAWLSTADSDRETLVVGRRLLHEALAHVNSKSPEVVFALMHHPVSWLAEFERQSTDATLQSDAEGADVILRGHEHSDDIRQVQAGPGRAVYLSAGALYDEARYPKTCMLGSWDAENLRFRVLPMVYSASAGQERWIVNQQLYGPETSHRAIFDQKPRGPSPQQSPADRPGAQVTVEMKVHRFPGSTAAPTASIWVEADPATMSCIARVEYRCLSGSYADHTWTNRSRDEKFCQTWGLDGEVAILPRLCFRDGTSKDAEQVIVGAPEARAALPSPTSLAE